MIKAKKDKIRKRKKDKLQETLETTIKCLDKVYDLLDDVSKDFQDDLRKDDIVLHVEALQETAKEMGQDHIDFMGMA